MKHIAMTAFHKIGLGLLSVVVVSGLVVLYWPPAEPDAASASNASGGATFEVQVLKPRIARPLFGILPTVIEERLEAGGELKFDQTTSGAEVGSIGPDHLELRAAGWDLHIQTDGDRNISPETNLVYPMVLAEQPRVLRCRPSAGAKGFLHVTTRQGTNELDGSFQIECGVCENAATGKVIAWPPAALTVRGRFAGIPPARE